MALTRSLESEIEIKASADHFYDTLKGKKEHRVHHIAPNHIHKVDVHEGDWETSGSIKELTFAVGDTVETLKEKIEFDDENKKITFVILEGDVLKYYKNYKVIVHVIPKGEGSLVKWTLVYEKVDGSAPEPTKYKDLVVNLTKDIETHLLTSSLESEIEIRVSADHFYDILKGKKEHRVHDVAPNHIHKVEVHEGDWETSGSIKELTFAVGDTVETLKEKIEFDDENKKITFVILEGDVLKYYKNYKVIVHVIPKGEGSLVKWTLVYDKVDESAPEPTKYKDLVVNLTKDIEIHLLQTQ